MADRLNIPGFRQVNPVEARMGAYLEVYDDNEAGIQGLKRGLIEAEKAMRRHKKKGEIVYTKMRRWAHGRNNDVWQIYFIAKG